MSGTSPLDSTPRRPDRAAFGVAALLVVIAGVIFWDTARIGTVMAYSPVGPATVPFAVACALVGLAIWTVFAAFRGDFPEREHQEIKPIVWIVGGLAAQMLLLTTAGFSIATGILFAATAAAFGRRKIWFSLPIGIALSFVVWMIFARLLRLSLPAGPLERLFF